MRMGIGMGKRWRGQNLSKSEGRLEGMLPRQMLFRERRLQLLRVRARAWAWVHSMRAGIRTATPVAAGPRAGGTENAVPTTASIRQSDTPQAFHKVGRDRYLPGGIPHGIALKT